MIGNGTLTFREFVVNEPLPLATIQDAVLEFLRGRDDAVLFGAQAVNAYVDTPRMTQDIDIVSPRAEGLAHELREHLATRFRIAVRIREIGEGRGYRLYQVQKPRNRHLVDLRPVAVLPPSQKIAGIRVVAPAELIVSKIIALQRRRGKPKSGTDWRDLAMLLLKFPQFQQHPELIEQRLKAAGADAKVLAAWEELAAQKIPPEEEEDEF